MVGMRPALALIVLASACLAACARVPSATGGQPSETPVVPPTESATASPSPIPSVRIVYESPMPSRQSFEHEATVAIGEMTGADCFVSGSSLLVYDPTDDAERIGDLPGRTGWLDEPWVWAGSSEALADALGGTLIGQTDIEAWVMYVDAAGEPRGESFWAYPTQLGDTIWHAKDSVAATPCPPDADVPQSVAPQPTPDPATDHLGIDIATFAERWNEAVAGEALAIGEVVVTVFGEARSFSPDLSAWLTIYGRAWGDERVRAIQVKAEPELAPDPAGALVTMRDTFASTLDVIDPTLSAADRERVIDELGIATLDWHPDDPAPNDVARSEANGIAYSLTGSGFPEWTLHVYAAGDPEEP